MIVNKAELSVVLGCSRPTLTKWIANYGAAFPVISRGGVGQDWSFESDEVVAFLARTRAAAQTEADARERGIRQLSLTLGDAAPPNRGNLCSQQLGDLARSVDAAAADFATEHRLSDDQARALRDHLAALWRGFAQRWQLKEPAREAEGGGN